MPWEGFPFRVKTMVIHEVFLPRASPSCSFLDDSVDIDMLREMCYHGESLRTSATAYLHVTLV